MNWVVFGVITGLIVFNLLGVGLWHYGYHKDYGCRKDYWKTDKTFWTWTVYLFFFGTAYCVIRLILLVKSLFNK